MRDNIRCLTLVLVPLAAFLAIFHSISQPSSIAAIPVVSDLDWDVSVMSYHSWDFEIHGRVQGVFFRKYTEKKANELKILGWVQNNADGTVSGQAYAQDSAALSQFQSWLSHQGSPKSTIKKALFSNEQQSASCPFTSFSIRK